MAYEELADLISTNSNKLAAQVAQELAKNIPDVNSHLEQTTTLFVAPYVVMANYLRNHDQLAYKQFYHEYFTEMIARGISVDALQLGNSIFYAKAKDLVMQTWPKEEQATLRNNSLRRLDSLQRMDIVKAITTNILRKNQ